MTRRRALGALLAATALAALGPPGTAAAKGVPASFFGVVAEPELLSRQALAPAGTSLGREMYAMVHAGVGTVRISFFWATAEPYETWADVPERIRPRLTDVGGRPFDFTETDRIVAAAARRRLEVLPVVLWAPSWAARYPGQFASPPAHPADYARFVSALARRYGPRSRFWREHRELPREPIRDWQVWNEPTMPGFWLEQPFARRYVALLRATRPALRRVDPRARLVLAGLVYDSPGALRAIYRAGGRRWFDVVAIHPFTLYARNVAAIAAKDRRVMRAHGDRRKPLFLTEVSWPSSKGKAPLRYGYEMTERGQAQRVSAALTHLARRRHALRIERVYWYAWLSRDRDRHRPFDYAGLSRLRAHKVVRKPAYFAYRRTALKLERR